MGAMLGLVLSDNVITLFVFWELTSISSYLLIGFHHHTETSRASALKALLVTGAGGLLLLAGLLLMMLAAAQLGLPFEKAGRISAMFSLNFHQHPLYLPILLLLLLGAFTKSAQVPFHFWLPAAMAAPTPVSAYLHSATMVKAGVYLLARFHPILGGILLAALAALAMSTIDSQLLSATSSLAKDIYEYYFDPKASDAKLLKITRYSMVVLAIIATWAAIRTSQSMFFFTLYAGAGLCATFGPSLVLSLYWKRLNKYGTIAAMLGGMVIVIIWYNTPSLKAIMYEGIAGFFGGAVIAIIVSLLTPPPPEQSQIEEELREVAKV
jgi:hypothetical protein